MGGRELGVERLGLSGLPLGSPASWHTPPLALEGGGGAGEACLCVCTRAGMDGREQRYRGEASAWWCGQPSRRGCLCEALPCAGACTGWAAGAAVDTPAVWTWSAPGLDGVRLARDWGPVPGRSRKEQRDGPRHGGALRVCPVERPYGRECPVPTVGGEAILIDPGGANSAAPSHHKLATAPQLRHGAGTHTRPRAAAASPSETRPEALHRGRPPCGAAHRNLRDSTHGGHGAGGHHVYGER